MSKVNYRRVGTWKVRVKLPPNRIFVPSTVYNKHRERDKLRKRLKNYEGIVDYENNN